MFEEQKEAVSQGKCPMCNSVVLFDEFTDALSEREYQISGLCQSCQDKIFADPIE